MVSHRYYDNNEYNGAILYGGNATAVYLGRFMFESPSGHRLSWLRRLVGFLST